VKRDLKKRIIYVQYTNPAGYPPLEHSSQIFAENDWDVLFLGTGALGADKLRFDELRNIRVLRLRFRPPGIRQKLNYAFFNLWCLAWFVRWRPDCVYFSDLQSCPLGLVAALLGMRTVFHEHDVPGADAAGAFGRCLRWSRRHFARRAELCVVPNAKRGALLVQSTGVRRGPAVVWNCSRSHEIAPPRSELAQGALRLLYHGSIVPDRLPLTVIDALDAVQADLTLTVVGYETTGARGYMDALRRRACELGISERLNILGTLARRQELMSVCRRHDAGLALMPLESEDPNLGSMAGASNKPYDYLACGLALLVSELPDWEEMFVRSGYGLSCNPSSSKSIAEALNALAAHPDMTRLMGERGRRRVIEEWNYDHQFRPVMVHLDGNGRSSPEVSTAAESGFREKAIR
jgi:glycosyltransferase involved in cell wall biosynthesis